MTDELYKFLEKQWRRENHKKYHKYFNEWVVNLTDDQIYHFNNFLLKEPKANELNINNENTWQIIQR